MSDFIDENTVFLLDSYGLIYREYYAFMNRPLTNSRGENISAVFGFFRNIGTVLKNFNPKFMVAAFDSRTPTFRHQKYSEYKATRAKTPEDLKAQFPWVEDCLNVLGIPVLRKDGFEADDVIATIARACSNEGRKCVILSGDKDLQQLVNDKIHILKPDKTKIWAELDEQAVLDDWGVSPEKLLDLLSLTGDSADNVPGVKGCGEKTAVKLLSEYGSLEGIYEHAEEIKGALGEKLRSDKKNAFFSKQLITLKEDVPLEQEATKGSFSALNISHLKYAEFAAEMTKRELPALARQYKELFGGEQNPVAPEGTALPSNDGPKKNKGDYKACTQLSELKEFVDNALKAGTVAFDTETDSLDTQSANLVGFSLAYEKGKGIYVPLILTDSLFAPTVPKKDALDLLRQIFESGCLVVMHNAKFDLKVLQSNGLNALGAGTAQSVAGRAENRSELQWSESETVQEPTAAKEQRERPLKIADTMIAAWILEPDKLGRTPYSLEYLAETKLLLKGTEYDEIVPKDKNFADVPLEVAAQYGAEDADFTLQLWFKLSEQLKTEGLFSLYENLEMKILPILARMEVEGIHLDSKKLTTYGTELSKELLELEKKIHQTVGHEFNIASPKQLSTVLFEELGLKPGKKTKTGYSTDTTVLEELASEHPVPAMILEYRAKAKLLSTYVQTLPELTDENERIHTTFMQTGTATGRLSSKDPNLQNIPVRDEAGRKIRSAFTAPEGKVLISADYAQIELVVLAHLSGDKNLCAAFNAQEDVHKSTAALIYKVPPEQVTPEMRRSAKTLNFGLMYGMSAFRLANELKISRTQAAQFIENYFAVYSGVKDFFDRTVAQAEEKGFIETIKGRRRKIIGINSANKMEKESAIRMAKNSPIQGSAADIVKLAMIDVDKALTQNPTGAKLLLQVHDELILECPNRADLIDSTINLVRKKMEGAVKLSVPLRVSIECGKAWGEFH